MSRAASTAGLALATTALEVVAEARRPQARLAASTPRPRVAFARRRRSAARPACGTSSRAQAGFERRITHPAAPGQRVERPAKTDNPEDRRLLGRLSRRVGQHVLGGVSARATMATRVPIGIDREDQAAAEDIDEMPRVGGDVGRSACTGSRGTRTAAQACRYRPPGHRRSDDRSRVRGLDRHSYRALWSGRVLGLRSRSTDATPDRDRDVRPRPANVRSVSPATRRSRAPRCPSWSGGIIVADAKHIGRNADRMDEDIRRELGRGRVIDITTIGRRTGLRRRIEIVTHVFGGHIYISGKPSPRSRPDPATSGPTRTSRST